MSFIIGTAGHIDHGKTSLVRSITGIDLDSSPEEKERGITISLGFTSTTIEDYTLSFVDVPGHERLIRTMIAGATGLDAVLLCVSAVDSVMPQTTEHLQILNLLGIKVGLIALTMCDLASEEDIEFVREEIQELVEGTFLEGAPIVQTASGAEPFGQDQILQHLQKMVLEKTEQTVTTPLPFRLPIDRVFTQRGFGTVVTGTSRGGRLCMQDRIRIEPSGLEARIRDMQCNNQSVEEVAGGSRVALNLTGVSVDDLTRGDVIVQAGSIPLSQILDLHYTHLDATKPLVSGARIRLLFGSSEALGKVYVLNPEGTTEGEDNRSQHFLQIRLDKEHLICAGDRCIIRRESPLETLGGGTVLDPYAPKIRSRDISEQAAFLDASLNGDSLALLGRMQAQGRSVQECALLKIPLQNRASNTLLNSTHNEACVLGKKAYSPSTISLFLDRITNHLLEWHRNNPLKSGITAAELAFSIPFLEKDAVQTLLHIAGTEGLLLEENHRLHHKDFSVVLTDAQQTAIDKLLQSIKVSHLEGIPITEISSFPKSLLDYLFENNRIVRISTQLLHTDALHKLFRELQSHFQDNTELNTTDFKSLTQLSRKFSIPLLEWLDENHKTRRQGDVRIAGRALFEDTP